MKRRTKWLIVAAGGILGLAALIVFLPAAVWRVVGWAFLAFAALLALLLLVPLTIGVKYSSGQLAVKVRVLFLPIKLWPRTYKPKKEKKPRKQKPKKEPEDEEKPKEKKKRSFGEMWLFIKRIAAASTKAMRVFVRHVRVHGVKLVLPVHASEADEVAINYARIQAVIGGARAVLDKRLHVKYKKLALIPDFAGEHKGELLIACKITFCPGIILVMGFVFLKKFMRKRAYSRKQYRKAIEEKKVKTVNKKVEET